MGDDTDSDNEISGLHNETSKREVDFSTVYDNLEISIDKKKLEHIYEKLQEVTSNLKIKKQ